MRNMAFVTAVESGTLEAQCSRMIESLRRHGGAYANCQIVVVNARFGPRLTASTLRQFRKFDVQYFKCESHPRYAWFHYLNKIIALRRAEQVLDAHQLVFLDCDTLVVQEPSSLHLHDSEDFAAAPSDEGCVGTTGEKCVHDNCWRRICGLLDMSLDSVPWTTTYLEQSRIRLYWNAGIYVYRRATRFADRYFDACLAVLQANEGFAHNGEHSLDQVLLALSVVKHEMRWRHLPESHNYPVASFLPTQLSRTALAEAAIIHYHDAMHSHTWDKFLLALSQHHPHCVDWLASQGPITNPAPMRARVLAEMLRISRGIPRKRYRRLIKTSI